MLNLTSVLRKGSQWSSNETKVQNNPYMAVKTNKSYSKRLKVTPSGKIMGRKPGFNHFNAKQSRVKQLAGKKGKEFAMSAKDVTQFLPHHN